MQISMNTEVLGKSSIEKMENGYYRMPVGAVNCFNSAGAFYTDEGLEEVLGESTIIYKKLVAGQLYGEKGHPRKQPGQTWKDFIRRILHIDMDNSALLFKGYEVVEQSFKVPGATKNVKIIYAVFKPSGPKAKELLESLEDPDSNTAFSVRSLTTDTVINGIIYKRYRVVVVWDWVHAPGIEYAQKYNGISLESEDSISINTDDHVAMNEVHDMLMEELNYVSNEDDSALLKQIAGMFDCRHGSACSVFKWD